MTAASVARRRWLVHRSLTTGIYEDLWFLADIPMYCHIRAIDSGREHLIFRRTVAEHCGARTGADRARARTPRERGTAFGNPRRTLRRTPLRPRRGFWRRARPRDSPPLHRADIGPTHCLLRVAGDPVRPRSPAARSRDRGLAQCSLRRDGRAGPPGGRAAPTGTPAPAQSRAWWHRRAGAYARAAPRRARSPRRSQGRRQRFRPHVLIVVQPRLPGAAADRLGDAGQRAREDHPLRGGAPDPRLGRFAPAHRSTRPALLRLLPSGAGRRSV